MFNHDQNFNTPSDFMVQYRAEQDAEAKKIRDEFNARVELLKLANAELKAENDAAEAKLFKRIYDENYDRLIAKGYTKELADTLAKSVCQYEENKMKGYSND